MPVVAAQLIAQVTVQGDVEAKERLKSVGDSANTTSGGLKSALGNAISFATGMGVYNLAASAVSGLKDQFVDTIKVAMTHQDVMAQTNQVVKSTHDVSGMTATAVNNLAESLSHVTKFSDDSIQSGENLLMTFTGIGKQVFPQATQAMLDLSQATGQSLSSSAMQLGKALNDPLTGMAALQRVGVTFSATEKEQIKTMMAHNDVIGAQKVMLNELSIEFGGSATAAGKTFSGQLAILGNDFDDIKQKIGMAVIPILTTLMSTFSNDVMPQLENFSSKIGPAVTKMFGDLTAGATWVGNVLKSLNFSDFLAALSTIRFEAGYVIDRFSDLTKSWAKTTDGSNPLATVITNLVKGPMKLLTDGLWLVSNVFIAVDSTIQKNKGTIENVDNTFKQAIQHIADVFVQLSPGINLFQVLSDHAQELGKWFQSSVIPALQQAEPGFLSLWNALKGLLPVIQDVATTVHNLLQKAFTDLLPIFEKVIPIAIQLSGLIANGLSIAIKFLTPYLKEAIDTLGVFAEVILNRVAPIATQWFTNLQVGINNFLTVWKIVWPYASQLLKGIWDEIVGIVKVAWALVSGIIEIGLDILSGNWKQAWIDLQNTLKNVWDGIKTYLQGMWEIIEGVFSAAWAAIQAIFAPIGQWFQARWDEVTSGVISFKNGVIGHFNELRSGAGGIFRSLVDDIIGWLNDGITSVENFVNFFGTAINNLADKLGGHDPVGRISLGRIPTYAEGTAGHPGGPAIVGERGPELVMLPKGASVLPNDQTSKLLSGMGIPGYANGIGDVLGNIGNWVSGGAKAIVDNAMNAFHISLSLPPALASLSSDIMNSVKGYATDFIKGLLSHFNSSGSAGPGQAVNVPGSVSDWIRAAIGLTGVPGNWLNDLAIIAMHESGGNPNAVNNWDSNAQNGTPSEGLMQTIGPTFAAYMVAGHGNILNPIDNAAAAINYIKSRYGSVFNVPGIISMMNGGPYEGYANGTNFASGGMAWVGERGPELMYVPRGAQITPNHQIGSATAQPQIVVNPPPIYLDGRLLANGLMPYIVDNIRYSVGTHGI